MLRVHSEKAAHIVAWHTLDAEIQIAEPEGELLVSKTLTLIL